MTQAHVLILRKIVEEIGADKGILVSEGGFQSGAISAANKTNVSLISPDDLRAYLAKHLSGMEHRRPNANSLRDITRSWKVQLDALPANSPASAYEPYLLASYDQPVQKAAIKRLVALGGSSGVLLLARRLLNPWGMTSIEFAQKGLGQLEQSGGLLVLAAFLLSDARFYYEKLETIARVAQSRGDADMSKVIAGILQHRIPRGMHFSQRLARQLPSDLSALRGLATPDVACGVDLSAFFCSPVWADVIKSSRNLETAFTYTNNRLPGLIDVLQQLDLATVV